MSVETEVKLEIGDPEAFCRRLGALKPAALSARHFEDNHLLDFPDGRLQSRRSVFRIRIVGGRATLTFKGAPRPGGIFKVREELETGLEDDSAALEIFARMGMHLTFRYQKYRREYALGGVRVAVDETPIGNYAELEGPEERIRALAGVLEIPESRFLRASYYSLYREFCRKKGTAPHHMIF